MEIDFVSSKLEFVCEMELDFERIKTGCRSLLSKLGFGKQYPNRIGLGLREAKRIVFGLT